MQEHHVTAGGQTFALPEPFFVLATQNPIEQEGTYPLPEAQLDRFMFHIRVRYPSRDEELAVMKRTTSGSAAQIRPVLHGDKILEAQDLVRQVVVADHVFDFAADLVRATRPKENGAIGFVRELIAWGAGPRASQYLILAAKARAVLNGRLHATTGDVRAVAAPVLRHRLVLTFQAEAQGTPADDLVVRLLEQVRPAREDA
jgi:MoxR-like ATPase